MHFGERALCEQTDFDCADQFLFVARRDLAGGFRIQALQYAMQVAGRMALDARPAIARGALLTFAGRPLILRAARVDKAQCPR